jgi:hypothetical protein
LSTDDDFSSCLYNPSLVRMADKKGKPTACYL